MPLEQRVVNPIYVSRGCFSLEHGPMPGQTLAQVPNELECVTNGTLGSIIRQLSSLSKHAEDLFGCLLDDIGSMLSRSASLQKRIDGLTGHVERLDSSTDSMAFYNSNETGGFHRKQAGAGQREQFDQQVVARTTIPTALREVYDQCDAPPPLDKLNPFRDDTINGLKLYTNPNYFFELWRKEMLSQDKNKNKVKLKGENAHKSSNKRSKGRPSGSGLPHQASIQSSSTVTDSPYHPSMVQQQQQQQQQIYGNHHHHSMPGPPAQQQQQQQAHYHPQAIYGYQQQQQPVEHLVSVKREEPNPNGPGTRTVVEGAYLDQHNYQHHYIQYHPNQQQQQQQGQGQVPPPPPPPPNMFNGQNEYQQGHTHSRPNSLELSQQQGYPNGPYYQGQQYQRPVGNNYGSPAGTVYAQGQYSSPNSTLNTPTRRGAQVSRPSGAPPPPPPGSGPNSQPSTPLHKTTRIINGQEVEMRGGGESGPPRGVSRDSLPPPPPPPPNQMHMMNGAVSDASDPALPPPPPPPPPPSQSYNGPTDSQITSPPPPPPPPMLNGSGPVAATPPSQQYKSTKPTAEELQSVKLKKTTPPAQAAEPVDDVRSNLLAAIRHGIKLRRVEESKQREVERSVPLHDVASILARRVAMEMSDSEGDAEEEDDSDAWDDESEC